MPWCFGWLYDRTGGALPVVTLFHTGLNMASATTATAGLPAALVSAAVIVVAVVILRREPPPEPPLGARAAGGAPA